MSTANARLAPALQVAKGCQLSRTAPAPGAGAYAATLAKIAGSFAEIQMRISRKGIESGQGV